ncbi:MAG: NAD-dependent epimerase/dehydratase family protein [Bacteroidaceae bacterium]|nr:NAD-dependent epimerase/dehydratase family protein [Bacteroidaceae bacterium]
MRITLIGASGFIGTRLIDVLKADYQLKNIDIQPSHFFNELTFTGDVRDYNQINPLLSETDLVVLLAAQHRDDVTPTSLYYDTNVEGMKNVLKAMDNNGVKRLIFFSSVAIYGLNKNNPDEDTPADPFNHYGKSKWQAEQILQEWHKTHDDWNIDIIRPTVIFGERNRGNVYNLLHQLASGRFIRVGKGTNVKSMAYVGNVVAFVEYMIEKITQGYNVFNYIDKPDFDMNQLTELVCNKLGKRIPSVKFPYWMGMAGGYFFDFIAFISRKKLSVSSVRVKKYCSTTQFDSTKAHNTGFIPPYSLQEGLTRTLEFEFIHPRTDEISFESE